VSNGPAGDPGKAFTQGLGISVAQEEVSMKKADKTLKSADLAQQNLPGDGNISAAQNEQPKVAVESASDARALAGVSLAGDARLLSLEKTHDLVATHAMRLTQSTNDSLRVVIEPGSGTRISLELRFANGAVEAQALLHRGDYNFLNNHWAELQQRLEPRGVHLGALACSTGSPGNESHGRNSSNFLAEEQPTRSAFADFALDGMKDSRPAKRAAKTHAGWESWA
jgi:hypothetical protein